MRQIQLRDPSKKCYITNATLLRTVARKVNSFLNLEVKSYFLVALESVWLVLTYSQDVEITGDGNRHGLTLGDGNIRADNIYILGIVNVTCGSWQPILKLKTTAQVLETPVLTGST